MTSGSAEEGGSAQRREAVGTARHQGRRPRPIFLLVGALLAAGLGVGLFTGVGTREHLSGRPGSTVPSFSLPRLGASGRVGVPADGGGAGRPAILLFFASWCSACHQEVPALASTYRAQTESDSALAKVSLLGVDGSDPTQNALAFVHSSGVTFPVGADRTFDVTQGLFGFSELPETVFVDSDGTIVGIHYGALSTAQFVHWERRLLTSG